MKLIGMLNIISFLDFILIFYRMLDTGFEPDIRKLEDLGLPQKDERITSMFSATFPDEVQRLAKHFLRSDYVFLAVGILGGANEDISQTIELVPQGEKKDRLFQLLEENLSKKNKTKIEFLCFFLKKLNVV
jgi:superfamily II DNA/RNA helicase